jgi:hypothetical protein
MRESGASTKEIAHTLRMIARELESAIQPAERD